MYSYLAHALKKVIHKIRALRQTLLETNFFGFTFIVGNIFLLLIFVLRSFCFGISRSCRLGFLEVAGFVFLEVVVLGFSRRC